MGQNINVSVASQISQTSGDVTINMNINHKYAKTEQEDVTTYTGTIWM